MIDQLGPFKVAVKPLLERLPGLEIPEDGGIGPLLESLIDTDLPLLRRAAAVAVCPPDAWQRDESSAEIARIEKRLGSADAMEFFELVLAIFSVNLDFFARRLAPRLTAVKAEILGAGLTLSNASSPPVTN